MLKKSFSIEILATCVFDIRYIDLLWANVHCWLHDTI